MAELQVMMGLTVELGKGRPLFQCPRAVGSRGSRFDLFLSEVPRSCPPRRKAVSFDDARIVALEPMIDRSPSAAERVGGS